jgi:hypothetical protein
MHCDPELKYGHATASILRLRRTWCQLLVLSALQKF